MILLGYLPFVILQLLNTRALSIVECGTIVSVLTFFVYLTIPVFHAVWINDTLFKWGSEFTQSYRSQGESTERLAGAETGEKKSSDAKKFHDETVAKYVGQRNQMRYVALTCAVASVAFFIYLNIFGSETTFCVSEGEVFGTLSWAFLDVCSRTFFFRRTLSHVFTFIHTQTSGGSHSFGFQFFGKLVWYLHALRRCVVARKRLATWNDGRLFLLLCCNSGMLSWRG